MKTDENMAAMPNDIQDDLTIIDGLGKQSADVLHEFEIQCFADFGKFNSPTDLHNALEKVGIHSIPLSRIENKNSKKQKGDWLQQAKELVQLTESDSLPPEANTAVPTPSDEEWHEHANYILKFYHKTDKDGHKTWRTNVYQEHNHGDENEYLGIEEPTTWVNWILERANLPDVAKWLPTETKVDAITETEISTPNAPEETKVKILDVVLSEAEPSPSRLEKQLVAKVHFQLTGNEAETVSDDSYPLKIEVHTVDLKSEDANLVISETEKIQPLTYTVVRQFPMPQVGHYGLQSRVTLSLPDEKKVVDDHRGVQFKVKS